MNVKEMILSSLKEIIEELSIEPNKDREEEIKFLENMSKFYNDKIRLLGSALYLENLTKPQWAYLETVILPVILKAKELRHKNDK